MANDPLIQPARLRALTRGIRLEYFSIGYSLIEALVAVSAGVTAGSIALLGFGLDSLIEFVAAAALLWRFKRELGFAGNSRDADARHVSLERKALYVVGATFVALAVYVLLQAGYDILAGGIPRESPPGIVLAAISLVVMPVLAVSKQNVAGLLGSRSLAAEAKETWLCGYLSLILLAGLMLNAGLGWSWADPLAALAMLPLIVNEAREAFEEARDEGGDDDTGRKITTPAAGGKA